MKDKGERRARGSEQRRERVREAEKDRVRERDRGRGPWGRRRERGSENCRVRGSCSRSWRNLHVLIILKTSK